MYDIFEPEQNLDGGAPLKYTLNKEIKFPCVLRYFISKYEFNLKWIEMFHIPRDGGSTHNFKLHCYFQRWVNDQCLPYFFPKRWAQIQLLDLFAPDCLFMVLLHVFYCLVHLGVPLIINSAQKKTCFIAMTVRPNTRPTCRQD